MAREFVYRIGGSDTGISQADQDNNILCIYDELAGLYGWTKEAIAGACGCFHEESGLNPGIYESSSGGTLSNLPYFPGGMGLAQWTDYPAYTGQYPNPLPWAAMRDGWEWYDGVYQCYLMTKAEDPVYTDMGYGQGARWGWQTSSAYTADNMSWSAYKAYTGSITQATRTWFFCFEWHASEALAYQQLGPNCITDRIAWANYAYQIMQGQTPDPPGPGPGPSGGRMPFWMYLKRTI